MHASGTSIRMSSNQIRRSDGDFSASLYIFSCSRLSLREGNHLRKTTLQRDLRPNDFIHHRADIDCSSRNDGVSDHAYVSLSHTFRSRHHPLSVLPVQSYHRQLRSLSCLLHLVRSHSQVILEQAMCRGTRNSEGVSGQRLGCAIATINGVEQRDYSQ